MVVRNMIKEEITSLTHVCYRYEAECLYHYRATSIVPTAQSPYTFQIIIKRMDN